jgi:membrane protease YdiL (CAAX protease family)
MSFNMSLQRLFLFVAMVLPATMAWLYFVAAAPSRDRPAEVNLVMQSLYAVGKLVQFSLPIVCWSITNRQRLRPQRPSWAGWQPALLFGVLSSAAIVGIYFLFLKGHPLLAGMPERIQRKVTELGIAAQGTYILFAVFLCIVHSLLEEYYWRAFVFDGLLGWLTPLGAILVSSLAFASHHAIVLHVYTSGRIWTGTLPLSFGVFLGGVAWAWIYRRGNSVYPCWLSHALVDAGIMAVGYDMVFGT